jgi:uncharacterized protein (TIGR00645 family)
MPLEPHQHRLISKMEAMIFWSRWLQAPMYLGLIVCQAIYVYRFGLELTHLLAHAGSISETEVMLAILGMIDVVMIANLLYMVIVGGYETFVSKISAALEHPDRPEWLGHIDANLLKIKLAISIITISSIHLLKTFINAEIILRESSGVSQILAQLAIHIGFLISALTLAYIDKLIDPGQSEKHTSSNS